LRDYVVFKIGGIIFENFKKPDNYSELEPRSKCMAGHSSQIPGTEIGSPTDYGNDLALFNRASKIYEVESQSARHYESLRTQTTNVVVIATGALVTFALNGKTNEVALVLLAVAAVAFVICTRIGQAHFYHWYLAVKMRHIIIYGCPKLKEKKAAVDSRYDEYAGVWKWLDHEYLWQIINVVIPLGGAGLVFWY
jgi:hypothetical protein